MNNFSIVIEGTEYPMSTTLRVAYKIQGQHDHKSYTEIFQTIDKMPIEDQIGMLYASFECANPEKAKTFNRNKFTDYYLDNYKFDDLINMVETLMSGILGESSTKSEESKSEDAAGN